MEELMKIAICLNMVAFIMGPVLAVHIWNDKVRDAKK